MPNGDVSWPTADVTAQHALPHAARAVAIGRHVVSPSWRCCTGLPRRRVARTRQVGHVETIHAPLRHHRGLPRLKSIVRNLISSIIDKRS